MLSTPRQAKLNAILAELKKIPGVTVQQDDFDSTYVDVILYMNKTLLNQRPYVFLRKTLASVRKACKNWTMNVLNWPSIKYSYSPKMFGQKAEKWPEGYEHDRIKLEVLVLD